MSHASPGAAIMSSRRKVVLTVLVLLVILILLAVIVVPRLVDVDRYRPQVIGRLEQATGRNAEIGRLTLTLLPVLSIRVDNFALENPAGFPAGRFLEIQRIYAELDGGALLHRQIVVRSLKLEDPVVSLLSNAQGRWNSENPSAARFRETAWQAARAPAVAINKVELDHGRVAITNLPASGQAGPPGFEASGVSVELEDVNPAALGVKLASAPGRNDGALRPAILKIAWTESGAADPGGPAGAEVRPSGPLAARGTFSAQSARFGALEASNVKSGIELYGGGVSLKDLVLELCGGRATGGLVWDSASRPARYAAQLALDKIDVAQLLAAFPQARGKMTGTLAGNFNLTGSMTASPDPLAGKEGAGELTVRNGRLPTLQLNKNLMALIRDLVQVGPSSSDPSSFRSISADLELSGGQLDSRRISVLGNGVDLDASGTIALAGAGQLKYQGVAKLNATTSGVSNLLAGLLGSKVQNGKLNFPFTLTGTLDAPRFALKPSRGQLP
jgi:uncharacterized protein involved in outer membrane biogenesis